MNLRRLMAVPVLIGSFLGFGAPRDAVAIDVTGEWSVTMSSVIGPISAIWDFQQTGSQLSLDITYLTPFSGPGTPVLGTIDSATGAFAFDLAPRPPWPPYPPCPSGRIFGTASSDATAISGSFVDPLYRPVPGMGCFDGGGPFAGTRCGAGVPGCSTPGCGNGFVDPGEQCDDGLLESPCCSESCQLEPAGTGCASDTNVCTDDVCDASGTCQHEPNTSPCPSVCRPDGTCNGGVCTGAFAPAGTPCEDGNACTQPDQCNALGTCVSGARLSCGACEVCETSTGCVARPKDGCEQPDRSRLTLLVTSGERRSATWSQRAKFPPFPPGSIGDPTATTDYDLCAYDATGILLRATAPADGTCAGKPCWRMGRSGNGFGYRDPEGTPHGLTNVAVRESGKTVRVTGKGPYLDLPASLDGVTPPVTVQLHARSAAGVSACWTARYEAAAIHATSSKLKGK